MNPRPPQESAVTAVGGQPVLFERQLTFHWPEPAPASRTLKIEEDGDFWKRPAKPKIRLIGRWLERAGFQPGSRVHVICVAPGLIELRCPRSAHAA